MRSSSAKPIPRSQPFNNNNNNNSTIPNTRHNPSQNGKLIQQNNRDISRNSECKVNSITDHSPTPSEVKIFHEPLKVVASPKVGSLVNADHTPLGGNVRILQRKLNFRETARPRVDAKSEIIIPKSEKRIPTEKLVWKAEAKVGSLINAGHQPGGGQNKVFN
uniref:Microtubule-associated protein n=1 Tax=Meloidogyne javanica TaxID=6303 RepID=A0A915M383_MELJA